MFAVSAFVDLPAAASITRSGDTITNMARIVGCPTFPVEHLLYCVALGAFSWPPLTELHRLLRPRTPRIAAAA